MKKNLSTRIKRNLSRIKSLCIFITDVYLSLDSEFIENYGDGPKKKEERQRQKRNSDRCQNLLLILRG